MMLSDSRSYSCLFCSPYGVGYTSTIWFNQVRVAQAGVVALYPDNVIPSWIWQLPSVQVQDIQEF